MDRRQQHKRQGFRDVLETLGKPPLRDNPSVAPKRGELDTAVSQLDVLGLEQEQAYREARRAAARTDRLREELASEHLRPIARSLRALIGPQVVEEVAAALRVPSPHDSAESLFDAARALRVAADPYREQLVAAGLLPDSLEQLGGATQAFRDSVDEYRHCVARRVGATKAIREVIAAARAAVVVLDAVVRQQLDGKPEEARFLAEWESAVRATMSGRHSAAEEADDAAEAGAAAEAAPAA